MVFKKDLTPLAKGGKVTKHRGKGATEQRTFPRQRETLTGDDTFARAAGRYPKPAPAPVVPAGPPPATTPPLGMGVPPEDV